MSAVNPIKFLQLRAAGRLCELRAVGGFGILGPPA
jgi:hypothetical protein